MKNKKKENQEINQKRKNKPKKVKEKYPRGQFIFVVISFILLICICLYIGGRSFYYYSLQHQKTKAEANTLATQIKKYQSVVESGDGLYKLKDEYIFKGKEVSNYVLYSNRLFRILKINSDNSVKLVSLDNQTNLIWGNESSYETSNLYRYLNPVEEVEHTGIYLSSLNQPNVYLDNTSWCEGKIVNNELDCLDNSKDSLVTLLTAVDYMDALGTNSYLNDGTSFWLLGLDQNNENIYLNSNGTIFSALPEEGYGVKTVITIKNNIDVVSGDGTKENPFQIEASDRLGYVNSFVKLGNDIWRIYQEEDQTLKLVLNNYLQMYGTDYEGSYSNSTTLFDPLNRKNIAYYLNNTYLNSLSYQAHLKECTLYTGEISQEVGYDYLNIYQNSVNAKIGMLNMIDLKLNNSLNDYYLMNTTSSMGEMALVHSISGKFKEDVTSSKKKIVPTSCITKDQIIGGNGSLETPYVLE